MCIRSGAEFQSQDYLGRTQSKSQGIVCTWSGMQERGSSSSMESAEWNWRSPIMCCNFRCVIYWHCNLQTSPWTVVQYLCERVDLIGFLTFLFVSIYIYIIYLYLYLYLWSIIQDIRLLSSACSAFHILCVIFADDPFAHVFDGGDRLVGSHPCSLSAFSVMDVTNIVNIISSSNLEGIVQRSAVKHLRHLACDERFMEILSQPNVLLSLLEHASGVSVVGGGNGLEDTGMIADCIDAIAAVLSQSTKARLWFLNLPHR